MGKTLYAAIRYTTYEGVDRLDVGMISEKREIVEVYAAAESDRARNREYRVVEFQDGERWPFA